MTGLLVGSIILVAGLIAVVAAAGAVIARIRLSSTERTSGGLGNALSEVQTLIEPSRKNVVETKRVEERRLDDRSGEPPKP